jgi:hypothetical protein
MIYNGSTPVETKVTHFINYIESSNVNNSSYNYKNAKTTSDVRPIICVSSAKERKTQVQWAVVIE